MTAIGDTHPQGRDAELARGASLSSAGGVANRPETATTPPNIRQIAGNEPVHFISAAGRDANATACGVAFAYPRRGNGWRVSSITCPECDRIVCDMAHEAMRALAHLDQESRG